MPPPSTWANIDHIAIAPSGVFVIDAKRYKGKVEVRKPLFGGAKLVIRGRDKTKLVDGLKRQVEAVRAGLAVVEQDVPVGGCFCFINPDGQAGGSGIPLSGRFPSTAFRCSTRASFRSTSSGPGR